MMRYKKEAHHNKIVGGICATLISAILSIFIAEVLFYFWDMDLSVGLTLGGALSNCITYYATAVLYSQKKLVYVSFGESLEDSNKLRIDPNSNVVNISINVDSEKSKVFYLTIGVAGNTNDKGGGKIYLFTLSEMD